MKNVTISSQGVHKVIVIVGFCVPSAVKMLQNIYCWKIYVYQM